MKSIYPSTQRPLRSRSNRSYTAAAEESGNCVGQEVINYGPLINGSTAVYYRFIRDINLSRCKPHLKITQASDRRMKVCRSEFIVQCAFLPGLTSILLAGSPLSVSTFTLNSCEIKVLRTLTAKKDSSNHLHACHQENGA